MAQYVIAQVSSKEPKAWNFTDKKTGRQVPMVTYKVLVIGEEDAVDVNRKADGAKPVAGEVLDGTIEATDFGKRFKATPKPFNGNSSYAPRDDSAIQAQWAIKAAIDVLLGNDAAMAADMAQVEPLACELFAMIDRVKNSKNTVKEPELAPPGDLKEDGGFKSSDDF